MTTIPIISILTMYGIENNFRNLSCKTNITNNTLLVSGSATTQAISIEVTASMGDLHNPMLHLALIHTINHSYKQFIIHVTTDVIINS